MDDFQNNWAKENGHASASKRWLSLYTQNIMDETRDVIVVFYEDMKARIDLFKREENLFLVLRKM